MEAKEITQWQDEAALERFKLISPLLDPALDPAKRAQLRQEISVSLDPRVISRHENGGMFETETLVKYSLALGCTVEDLFPIRIAAQLNGKSEEAQRYWNMLMGLDDEQKQAVYHMISVLAAKTA